MEKENVELVSSYQYKGGIISIFRPVLTEEEQKRRMEKFKEDTAVFLYECEKERRKHQNAELHIS